MYFLNIFELKHNRLLGDYLVFWGESLNVSCGNILLKKSFPCFNLQTQTFIQTFNHTAFHQTWYNLPTAADTAVCSEDSHTDIFIYYFIAHFTHTGIVVKIEFSWLAWPLHFQRTSHGKALNTLRLWCRFESIKAADTNLSWGVTLQTLINCKTNYRIEMDLLSSHQIFFMLLSS